jgi:hypothetical protein
MLQSKSILIHCWSRFFTITTIVLALLVVFTIPVLAITHGEPDGDDHPNVGSIVVNIPGAGLFQFCSGTLIDDDVFLTASHCTAPLDGIVAANPGSEVLITFDSTISEGGTFYSGVWYTNPNYNGFQGRGGQADPGDVAVIVLDEVPGILPASLPPAGMLDDLKDAHVLRDTRFTAVGFGTLRDSNQTGFQGILDNLDRNRAEQGYHALNQAWLILPMTPSNGNGGTCYGDSGGPHFIHIDDVETDIVASITVLGDAPCKASDVTYRMDTESARSFLGGFVDLP